MILLKSQTTSFTQKELVMEKPLVLKESEDASAVELALFEAAPVLTRYKAYGEDREGALVIPATE